MATSGRINGSFAAGSYAPYVKWSVTQNLAANKSTMSVTYGMRKVSDNNQSYNLVPQTLTVKVNGTTYTRSITFDFREAAYPSDHDIVTISGIEIPHSADGTKSVSVTASHPTDISLGTGSVYGTAELTQIPRATTPALPATADIGSQISIGLTRAVETFTHNLKYKLGNGSWVTLASDVGTSYSWTIPMSLCSSLTSAASGTITVQADTYNGNTLIGSKTSTMTVTVPAAVKPAAALTVSLINENTTVAGWGIALKGFTKVGYTITADVTDDRGASAAAYEFSGNGEILAGATGTTGPMTATGSLTMKGRVQDTRGRWSDYSEQTVSVLDYTQPAITSCDAHRVNESGEAVDDGERVQLFLAGSVAGVGQNAATVKWRYKQTGGSWGAYRTIPINTETIITDVTFSKSSSYEIELSLWDSLNSSVAMVFTVPTEYVTLHLLAGGKGAAFGKYATNNFELELDAAWDMRYKGQILAAYISSIITSTVPAMISEALASAYMLGELAAIPADADADDYQTPGAYGVPGNATAATISHLPSAHAGRLLVYTSNGGKYGANDTWKYLTQEYREIDGTAYRRFGDSGSGTTITWGAWSQI